MTTRPIVWLIVGTVLAACASAPAGGGPSAPRGVSALALSGADANHWADGEPGHTDIVPRAYFIAPPVVPHEISTQTVSRNVNDCFDCHSIGDETEPGHVATKIPPSHYTNAFTGRKGSVDKGVVGQRQNCLSCHVGRTDATLPVGTAWRGAH